MRKGCLLFTLILTTLLTYSVFLGSFISPKKTIIDKSTLDDIDILLNQTFLKSGSVAETFKTIRPEYNRIVIILIDALRVDFVGEKYMPYLQNRLEAYNVLKFTAKVQPPTVTLPRIKALTTGSVPGFVDVVLNFGSSALLEDNVVSQAKSQGKKLVFYGDDTWLSLFPEHFIRSDGTTSFFVTDYTEVDNNVTRHLQEELSDLDFDMMILHYLGLDHIGHTAGPFSPLVAPKLAEMDNIIRLIHQGLSKLEASSLVIVCGDHGMSDQGGHGGATEAEINVPVLILPTEPEHIHGNTKKDNVKEIDQIDLAPTLAVLLGIPIPKNNLGTIVTDVLSGYSIKQKLTLLLINGLQMVEVLKHNVVDFELEKSYQEFIWTCKSFSSWVDRNMSIHSTDEQGYKLLKQFEGAIKHMSSKMSASATKYDVYGLGISILNLWLILFTLMTWSLEVESSWFSMLSVICVFVTSFIHLTVCTSGVVSDLMCQTSKVAVTVQCVLLASVAVLTSWTVKIFSRCSASMSLFIEILQKQDFLSLILIIGTVLHTLSLLSSSFVEEEHQTWYFYSAGVHVVILKILLGKVMMNWTLKSRIDQHSTSGTYDEIVLKNESEYEKYSSEKCMINGDFSEIKFLHTKNYNKSRLREEDRKEGNAPAFRHVAMVVIVLLLCRVMRTWNQTGNKWLNVPDTGDWLMRPENMTILSMLVGVSLMVVFLCKMSAMNILQQILYGVGLLFVYQQKSASGSVIAIMEYFDKNGCLEAQVVYLCILMLLCTSIVQKVCWNTGEAYTAVTEIHTIYILLFLVLSRPHNIVLVSMMVLQEIVVDKCILPWQDATTQCSTLYFLWMGQAAFFYQGNSNSISTVDVSAGYIGLHDYQPLLVGILLAISTYGGTIFWMLSCIKYLIQKSVQEDKDKKMVPERLKKSITDCVNTICLSRALPLAVYTVLVTLMRYHLFVWTVFSPKLLYEGMLTVVLSVISLLFLLCNFIL